MKTLDARILINRKHRQQQRQQQHQQKTKKSVSQKVGGRRSGLKPDLRTIVKKKTQSRSNKVDDLREILQSKQQRKPNVRNRLRPGIKSKGSGGGGQAVATSAIKRVEARLRQANQRSTATNRIAVDSVIPRVVIKNDLMTGRRLNRGEIAANKWRRSQQMVDTNVNQILQQKVLANHVARSQVINERPLMSGYRQPFSSSLPEQPTGFRTKPMRMDTINSPVHAPPSPSVLVTNLPSTITQSDIIELFGDIGEVLTLQMVNSTTAIVTYQSPSEATKACQTYNYRLLDGQPMSCTLLATNGAPTYVPTPTSTSTSLASSSGPFTGSHRAAAQALMSTGLLQQPSRASSTRSNVKFTVKI